MFVDLLCDQCRREFSGDEYLLTVTYEVLCPQCKNAREEL